MAKRTKLKRLLAAVPTGALSIDMHSARWIPGDDGIRFAALLGSARFDVLVTGEALAKLRSPSLFFLSGAEAMSAFLTAKDAVRTVLMELLKRSGFDRRLILGTDDVARARTRQGVIRYEAPTKFERRLLHRH